MPKANAASSIQPTLLQSYTRVRQFSEQLCETLTAEDTCIQSMPDVSPSKWHLAHTTWFFEQFILAERLEGYQSFHPEYAYLFNSYYVSKGERHARPERGLLSRPTLQDIRQYRHAIDQRLLEWLSEPEALTDEIAGLITLGLNHEQQHQELLLMDIKHVFSCNPLLPAFSDHPLRPTEPVEPAWYEHPGGLVEIGQAGEGFAFDNEQPRHKVWLESFLLAKQLVSNGDWRAFIEDGGYDTASLWLSEGWDWCQQQTIKAPLYWQMRDGQWMEFTLHGLQPLDPHRPVCHINYYEAAAYAEWVGARLPREAEWETLARHTPCTHALHPGGHHFFGQLWQWTASPYQAYPGFKALPGGLGEYNGKFMSSQMVLRGSACVTPPGHGRPTYRNFFYPHQRWQFAGLRLARDSSTS